MRDRSLGIMLAAMFGISGVTMLVLAWLLPALSEDRILAISAGMVGVLVACYHGLTLRTPKATRQVIGDADEKDKQ